MNENYSLKELDISKITNTIKNLLNKQLNNNNISKEEEQFINDSIKIYPDIVKEIGLGPEQIYDLIEKNEQLSFNILFDLSQMPYFSDYLYLFITRKWSINSLKVMNKLFQKVEFPEQYIYCYFIHCIYELKKENNKTNKIRMRKIFSFFLCNLLDHGHITIECIPPSIDEVIKENCEDPDILLLKEKIEKYRKEHN